MFEIWSRQRLIPTGRNRLKRRKTRGCRPLELHAPEIFIEERLKESAGFSHGVDVEARGLSPDKFMSRPLPYQRLQAGVAYTDARER